MTKTRKAEWVHKVTRVTAIAGNLRAITRETVVMPVPAIQAAVKATGNYIDDYLLKRGALNGHPFFHNITLLIR